MKTAVPHRMPGAAQIPLAIVAAGVCFWLEGSPVRAQEAYEGAAGPVEDRGTGPVPDGAVWTEVGRAVGAMVGTGAVDRGVVCCWTGTGVSIAANKVPGVRAALCLDAATASGARRWNDANVLAVGLQSLTPSVVAEVVDAFLDTAVDADELATIAAIEGNGFTDG